ncbi:MAG: PH domain-containing protein [Phycisphaera sp.]|nr:MAG: PH domain-containing protein [Phycisphaera sp.]
MTEPVSRHKILREASFDPKLPTYLLLQGTIIFVVLIVTIPLAVVYFLVGRFFIDKYVARMSCTLTERTLEIRKGLINRVESTIPLEKITDLQMIQGPIMRAMGLHGFKVETAGQSSGPGGHLVSLIGIVDAPAFREAVLDQRDAQAEGRGRAGKAGDVAAVPELAGEGVVGLLTEIRNTLHRVEKSLEHRRDI